MDEEEYEYYLSQVFPDPEDDPLMEHLIDEDGHEIPGCYRTIPAPF